MSKSAGLSGFAGFAGFATSRDLRDSRGLRDKQDLAITSFKTILYEICKKIRLQLVETNLLIYSMSVNHGDGVVIQRYLVVFYVKAFVNIYHSANRD